MSKKHSKLKIEETLPVKAVGVECLKESNPEMMSPHRYLHKWFARRPTAATRLAVLASVLPSSVSNDELLKLMKIAPRNVEHIGTDIEDYVVQKHATKNNRSGSLEEHFDYPVPHSRSPTPEELSTFHELLKSTWDGKLPTVIDPTAGGGTIPMESLRYGLPTISNELNPVAWLINKVILDFAPSVGSLESEIKQWTEKIDEIASDELEEYFPSENNSTPNHHLCTYSIECSSCGYQIPLTNRWWFLKKSSNEGEAFRPTVHQDRIEYEHVTLPDDVDKSEFDPNDGVVSGGDAECLQCGVVTETEEIKEKFSEDEFRYEVIGVRYTDHRGKTGYRAGTKSDTEAIEKAKKTIENDLRLSTFLSTERDVGDTDNLRFSWSYRYGMEQWKDIFNPRQLLSHATYQEAFEEMKPEIRDQYDHETAEAILVLLSLVSSKLINRNSRLEPIDVRRGAPNSMLGSNNLAFQWHYGESNMSAGSYSYQSTAETILSHYEELVGYFESNEDAEVVVNNGDAADLPLDEESVEAAVMDPPYGDNIRYAELSDCFYVLLREYLGDVFIDAFRSSVSDKSNEAVEDPARVDKTNTDNLSKRELAKREYEEKMSDIFSEAHRVLETGGVLTVYFTDKEISAWDSLTMSLINSGFNITATHTITSEMPQRIGMQGSASADSTLLLTCRKPEARNDSDAPTLWDDIQSETRDAARDEATRLLDSDTHLTKTDMIISAFGPTLRVFTENYPVVDMHDNRVRPRQALEEARAAVTEVLIDRELEDSLDEVDPLTRWYILSWLVYEKDEVPYDEARQLGIGVGVDIDEIKQDTKIWGKSRDTLTLKGQDYRVRDYTALEVGEKRRARAYPIDPREVTFAHNIDAVHAAMNVLDTKGSDFTWNWLKERELQNASWFKRTIRSLLQVLPNDHSDHDLLVNLISGETGQLLDINTDFLQRESGEEQTKTTLRDF